MVETRHILGRCFVRCSVGRFDLEQIRLALRDHIAKLDVPRRGILPERVIRSPQILEHSARVECEIPNRVLTPVENPSLIDKCRRRDVRQSENLVVGVDFGVIARSRSCDVTGSARCRRHPAAILRAGIDIDALGRELQNDGAKKFVKSGIELMDVISAKGAELARVG